MRHLRWCWAVGLLACGGGGGGSDTDAGAVGAPGDAGAGGLQSGGAGGLPSGGAGGASGGQLADAGPAPDDGCNPVGREWDCLLPFPSDHWRRDGRVVIPEHAQPLSYDDARLDLLTLHPADGFSPISQILALVPHEIGPGQLVTLDGDYTVSLRPESRTVLLDAETGERVLHLAETDPRAPNAERRGLILRPQVRLRQSTRYVVGIRALTDASGARIEPPASFLALRDGHGPAGLQGRFETDVFEPLALAGVPRDDLLLAWDFTTRSDADATADMLSVREQIWAAVQANPPILKEIRITRDVGPDIARQIDGLMEVPLFMETPLPGALLRRGEDGRPKAEGTADVPFVVVVPPSVMDDEGPAARFLQFGHGFFGSRAEVTSDFVPKFAQRAGMVAGGVDWWGMSTPDSPLVIGNIINKPTHSLAFVDRVYQGMANFIAFAHAARTTLNALPELARTDARPAYDPAAVYFYGISQGGILGGTYLALAPEVERGVLSVGGAGFAMLMHRARPFAPFLNVIGAQYTDALDQQKFMVLSQLSLDRIDPMTYAPHMLADTYPGGPAEKRVLLQLGIGDAQVPNLGHHAMARTLGLPLVQPAPRAIPALDVADAPLDGSGVVEFDFHLPEPLPGTYADLPADGNNAHEGVRHSENGMRQVDAFLRPGGRIEHTCDGTCDPE